MDLQLKGKTAVITGGDSGIGLATAKLLAEEGANIVLSDKTTRELKNAAKKITGGTNRGRGRVLAVTADVRKVEDVEELSEKAKSEFGNVDILVHCAGARGAAGDFLHLSDADWQETIDVDLMGAVRVCRTFIPHMLKNRQGRIVLVASENALQPYEDESPYNACKAAIINLTKCLSKAYSPRGVLINCVSPAFIATPMTDAMMKEKADREGRPKKEAIREFLKDDRPGIIVNRRGKPEEVAAVIALLASPLSSYVAGSNYRVDGGSVSTAFG